MKLKIKFVNSSINLNVELEADKQTYGELRKHVATLLEDKLSLPGVLFDISLNGKEPLVANFDAPLKDLGLVSGDIVRIISEDDSFRGLNVGATSKSSDGGVGNVFATNVASSSSNTENVEMTPSDLPSGTSADYDESNPDESEMQAEALSPMEEKLINRHLNEPVLCRESTANRIPSSLEEAYKSAIVSSRMDALAVVLHVLMTETGLCQDGDGELITPDMSRNGVYNLRYSYSSCHDKKCQLTCLVMNDVLAVHGVVLNSGERHKAFTINLDISKYILTSPSHGVEPVAVYGNLANLSNKFKDIIIYPMLRVIQIDAGFVVNHDLMSLPNEVKLHVLTFLDCPSLLKASLVCRELGLLASEQCLWKPLYLRKFSKINEVKTYLRTNTEPDNFTWKERYRRAYLAKKTMEEKTRKRLYSQHISYYYPNALPGAMPVPDFYPHPPGPIIIGGDHDRYPIIPPGAIPGVPPGFLGPRINPIDPLADIQFPGNWRPRPNDPFGIGRPRPNDPFGIGRPRFDPFGGGGSGGFI